MTNEQMIAALEEVNRLLTGTPDALSHRAWLARKELAAVLAALPAAPPPELVALVREWQAARLALDCERSAVDGMVDQRFYSRLSSSDAALLAYPLAEDTDGCLSSVFGHRCTKPLGHDGDHGDDRFSWMDPPRPEDTDGGGA